MQQNPYFSQNQSEDVSDPPQLPFPEPGQPATPDALQLPFPTQQATDAYASPQVPFPQPLPSTDTIDTAQIRFLQFLPMNGTEEMGETVQIPFPAQSSHPEMDTSTQTPFPQQSSPHGTGSTIQHPAPEQISSPHIAAQPFFPQPISAGSQATMPMPGLIELPVLQTMSAVAPAMTELEERESQATELAPSNQEAKRAIINGVISFVVSLFALATVAGFAGLVVGTFAVIYGLKGLRLARRLSNKAGRGQAIIGITLGLIACSIVLAAIIFRAPQSR